MTKSNDRNLFEELRGGLQEIRAFNEGRVRLRTHRVAEPDVAAIRTKMGLTQDEFAALIGVSTRTLQNWEQGHRRPRGPARALLMIAQTDPGAALRALQGRRM
jgi:putative transcriptional regulator